MSVRSFLTAAAVGAALMYYLDPDRGRRRRNIHRDKLGSWARRSGRVTTQQASFLGGQIQGAVQQSVPRRPDNPEPDDTTLKDRVESEVLRDKKIKQADIVFDVAKGVVEVRGQLDTQEDIDSVMQKVQKVPGVRAVHNYLHLPGTPAPNKASVLQVS